MTLAPIHDRLREQRAAVVRELNALGDAAKAQAFKLQTRPDLALEADGLNARLQRISVAAAREWAMRELLNGGQST